jgi:hypothetical protein
MLRHKIHFFISAVLLFSSITVAQQVEVRDAGKFSGSIDGKDFQNMIRYGKSEKLFTIATGDENFTLTINWNSVSSPAQIKPGATKLPAKDNSVTVLYLNNTMEMPFIISSGSITIIESSGKTLKGTLEFTAAGGGIPKEMGGAETKLSNGKFEINFSE